MQSFPDMSKQQRTPPNFDTQQQQRDSSRSSPPAVLPLAPASPALRSSNPPPQPAVAISHVPRPRFHSFSHNHNAEDDDTDGNHPVAFSASASSSSPSPTIPSAHSLTSPSVSPGTSPSQSPLLGRSPNLLSFSEKRKIAKEQAKEAEALRVAGASASLTANHRNNTTNTNKHNNNQSNTAKSVHYAPWRQRLSTWYHSNSFWVAVYSLLLLLTSVGNSIAFKKMINKMENYVYFLNQFTTVVFTPIFFAFVVYQFYFTDQITKEMTSFPKKKFFWMGVFDSVSGVLMLFGAVHTSGSNQALLANAVIPVTMLLSYIILKQRFVRTEYAGSVVIMLGVMMVMLPQLFPHLSLFSSEQDSGGDIGQDDNSDLPLFNFLFMLSNVPGALSSIYKELAFVDADIDANYLQAWVSLWQSIFGFALIPLNTLKFLGPQAVAWDKLWTSMVDGGWCLLGYNLVVPPHCTNHHVPDSALPPCDDCEGAWIPIAAYILFNMLFNVYTVLLIKHGSATLMFIIMTLRLPLIQGAFSVRAINDPPDSFGWAAGIGLAVILLGLVVYRWPAKRKKKAEAVQRAKGKDGEIVLTLEEGRGLLLRARTTGGMGVGDYGADTDEDERQLVIPLMGLHTQLFAARHHRQQTRLRLQRTGSEIRSSLYEKLGVHSPYMGRNSPMPRGRSPVDTSSGSRVNSPLLGGHGRSRTPPVLYGSLGERKEAG